MKKEKDISLATKADVQEAIEELAKITASGFSDVDKRFFNVDKRFSDIDKQFVDVRKEMREGFAMVLDEVRGIRNEVKTYYQGSRIEYGELDERMETLEEEVKRIKVKVKI